MVGMPSLPALPSLSGDGDKKALAIGAGAAVALGALLCYKRSKSDGYRKKPKSFELSGGAVDASKVASTVSEQPGA